MESKNIGMAWRLRRIAAGLRQQDVAARAGISTTRLSALERGELEPSELDLEILQRVCLRCQAGEMVKKLSELLTPRELDHIRLLAAGLSNREIAVRCGCSEGYINNKISLIYQKLGLGRAESGSPYDPRITLALRYDREIGRGNESDE